MKSIKKFMTFALFVVLISLLSLASSFLLTDRARADPADSAWRDEFEGEGLEIPPWFWINENSDRWSLTDNPEYLRIYASSVVTGGENLLLRPVTPGDFMIQTHVLFEPDTNFQFAGLVIWQDDENFLQLGRAFCDVEEFCVGNGIYFDKVSGGEWVDGNFGTPVGEPDEAYLRLERRGEMVRAFYSHDGWTSWFEIGTHWIPPDFQIMGVGLTASQDYNTPDTDIPADFDFFELSEGFGFLPEGFHDFDSGDVPSWACNAGGWASDPDDRAARVNVEIVVDHQTVANLVAEEFRQDLLDADVCEGGNCSFNLPLWEVISSYEPHSVAVWAQDTTGEWVRLSNSPKDLICRTYDIYTFNPLTGESQPVTYLTDKHEFNPRWSPDGRKIVHDAWSTDWSSHGIYITSVQTGVSTPLAGAEGGSYPNWAPNGRWIAFDRGADNDYRLFIISPTGGTPRLVTEDAFMASWAPNSRRLVYHQPSDGSIRTVNVNGGDKTLVVEHGNGPAWSPNGLWIAYEEGGDIWKVRVNPLGVPLAEPISLTSQAAWEGRPSWSPDSKTIAFHTGLGQDTDIWTIPASGGTATWLTGAPAFGDYDPNYANDGRHIAYASFSPNGQAAREWVAAFTYDPPAGGFTEGPHPYHFEFEWSAPEPGSWSGQEGEFYVANVAANYDGYVLLRGPMELRGINYPDNLICEEVDEINPNQPTRFLIGWLPDFGEVAYSDAQAHFESMTARVVWDGDMSAELTPHEIIPFRWDDWFQYVCTFTEAPPKMDLRVNYGHDWVESFYEAGHEVVITVTESDGYTVKATAIVTTEPKDFWEWRTGFQTTPEDWSPEPPDLQPYDWVYAQVDNGATAQVQLGDIQGEVNVSTDSIAGTVYVPWLEEPVQVECLDWGSGGGPFNKDFGFIVPDGVETYACAWDPETEWDLQPWQDIGVGYSTPDGHWVANAFHAEAMGLRVNYGHDWVESFYEAGHEVVITVTENDGFTVKATATVTTEPKDFREWQTGFQTIPEDWSPEPPDLQPYDWIYAQVDNGVTAQVQLGIIQGEVFVTSDSIAGTVDVPWLEEPVQVECLDWGSGGDPFNKDAGFISPGGSDPYACSWDPETEWDVQPWQDIGVGYATPDGHWVANAFHAEHWMAMWTYDLPAGFWMEGEHSYHFQWAYSVPEPGDAMVTAPMAMMVSSSDVTPIYDGYVLIQTWLDAPQLAWTGSSCEAIPAVHSDQPTRFVWGWVNDYSMTYEEARAHFASFTVKANWDGEAGGSAMLTMGELLPFTGRDDRWEYRCTLTEHP